MKKTLLFFTVLFVNMSIVCAFAGSGGYFTREEQVEMSEMTPVPPAPPISDDAVVTTDVPEKEEEVVVLKDNKKIPVDNKKNPVPEAREEAADVAAKTGK